ncbi:homoserine O-acetyltransferase [Paenibacillus baekrokdamisoli]|uniref:Homoserine O-acetyltransferase n=1 Tax=Paenibacillus baekrokdamisoli TaxID=1712516 RepID=A0A3G9IP28_9BACL|nr:alpha/beta fold hydrolase [Paenibacillus baekrokdamisoli]MBB3070662.1 homoserine O-acetyltransferase [Paenibacillus baekrokdamisoli]BBH20012.1 homoserine O-acetyltransferase [Paenibacillus baekrokdamisoli]
MDYEIFELGDVTLQSGVMLPDAFLAYKTYGRLNADRSNAIVYPTAFGDRHHNNEWLIGEGMALDTEKYFIIVPNLLGNGLSSSPSNTPPPFDKSNFPQVTIFDNVRLQHQLVTRKFGIEKIALVTGWSMGALQTFQWGASYPDMVERIAPFAGTAKTWPHTFVFIEGVKAPLLADALWRNGNYTEPPTAGLRAIGRVYAGWGFSQAFYREESFRQLGYRTLNDFLAGFWDRSFLGLDANNLLAMLWTWQHADISANSMYCGDFEKALRSIKAHATVMPGRMDLYFTPEDSEYETRRIPNANFRPIESIWGHFAGRGINPDDTEFIAAQLKQILDVC